VTQARSEALHFTTDAPPPGAATERFSTDDWPEHQRRSAAADFYAGVFRQDVEPIPGESFLMHGTIRHIPGLRFMSAESAERPGLGAACLHALKDDVLRNLEHGDVSIDAIAARHRMSPRQVQRLFGREGGTFSEFVLNARLAHAHRLLTDPLHAGEKIATIAFAAGFGDVSYFYRAFRHRYDLLPSDLRAAARRPN
jgi:AraC-like DNA-binding protein